MQNFFVGSPFLLSLLLALLLVVHLRASSGKQRLGLFPEQSPIFFFFYLCFLICPVLHQIQLWIRFHQSRRRWPRRCISKKKKKKRGGKSNNTHNEKGSNELRMFDFIPFSYFDVFFFQPLFDFAPTIWPCSGCLSGPARDRFPFTGLRHVDDILLFRFFASRSRQNNSNNSTQSFNRFCLVFFFVFVFRFFHFFLRLSSWNANGQKHGHSSGIVPLRDSRFPLFFIHLCLVFLPSLQAHWSKPFSYVDISL